MQWETIDDKMILLAKEALDKGRSRSWFAQTAEWAFDEAEVGQSSDSFDVLFLEPPETKDD